MIIRLYKNSRIKVVQQVQVLADKGYQGIHRYHTNSCIPHKKPRKGQLTPEQRQLHQEQARLRVRVEHVIRNLLIFRILSSRYRQELRSWIQSEAGSR